jgi:predicted Zn finger-like uncharacterized protein
MIISCTECKKKFKVESDLIPDQGRLLQCGLCNHKWFFKIKLNNNNLKDTDSRSITANKQSNDQGIQININNDHDIKIDDNINPSSELIEDKIVVSNKVKNKINYLHIFNLILVFIISFIALILIMETFKSPISLFFPNIDGNLESLYETLVDVYLFFIDLL